jgi:hypothetical protein
MANFPVFIDKYKKEHTCYGWGVSLQNGWEWYAFEPIKNDIAYGFVHGFEDEWGSFSLKELKEYKVFFTQNPVKLNEIDPPVGWTKK